MANPDDTGLALKFASLQLWFGREADYNSTRQRVLNQASSITSNKTAILILKLSSLRPAADELQQAAILALARQGQALASSRPNAWFELSLGMAEYRCGRYADAETTLRAAAGRPARRRAHARTGLTSTPPAAPRPAGSATVRRRASRLCFPPRFSPVRFPTGSKDFSNLVA